MDYDRIHGKSISQSVFYSVLTEQGGYQHPLIFEPGYGWVYGCGMDWAGRTV